MNTRRTDTMADNWEVPLIQLIDIQKIYQMGDTEVRANDGINLSIREGEFVAIVGKSGSGILSAPSIRRPQDSIF